MRRKSLGAENRYGPVLRMHKLLASLVLLAATAPALFGADAATSGDPLAAWRSGVRVGPACPVQARHTIHAYFNTCPESPDGRRLLFYASETTDSHHGALRILDRTTGEETLVTDGLEIEDAHRTACQQWISNGRRVAFHNVRDGRWSVLVADLDRRAVRTLVQDRQLCWGAVRGDVVPVYGCHWNPGTHRDLELVDVATGQVRTALTAAAVQAAYPEWIAKRFGDRPVSIFFPILSPDGDRVFFKMATPGGGEDFRSAKASMRQGLVAYDLRNSRFLFLREQWGHPAWHPQSTCILEKGNLILNAADGRVQRIPGLPNFSGSHPSFGPDGSLFVTDGLLENMPGIDGRKGEWGVFVCRTDGNGYVLVHRFDNSRGARSWRVSHPHPVFSHDGRRIYFNVSADRWTQLFVAESGPVPNGR